MGQSPFNCCSVNGVQPGTWCSRCDTSDVLPHGDIVPEVPCSVAEGLKARNAPGWSSNEEPFLANGDAEEAWSACREELRHRTRLFLERARRGVRCRFLLPNSGKLVPAVYSIDPPVERFAVRSASRWQHEEWCCSLGDVRNIWVPADSELLRRVHSQVRVPELQASGLLLIDAPSGPITILEEDPRTQEDFLDCMAVLIAARRLRSEPVVAAGQWARGPPPPEPRLRPLGKSLQSMHLSGPICEWLAQTGDSFLPPIGEHASELSPGGKLLTGGCFEELMDGSASTTASEGTCR